MSVVTVQLGQCGNQIGERLFSELRETCGETARRRFFRESRSSESKDEDVVAQAGFVGGAGDNRSVVKGKGVKGDAGFARSVLVDMEPKVVSAVTESARRSGTWQYDKRQAVTQQCGSANNWAYGFHTHGSRVKDDVIDAVRREVEVCDMLDGIQLIHSAAGGTGSGLGALVTEVVSDTFPDAATMSCVVWPHESGEVIVQHYNAMLTTASLYETTQGMMMYQNDVVAEICRKLLRIPSPSLKQLNSVIARHLAMVLLPHEEQGYLDSRGEAVARTTVPAKPALSSLLGHLCANPSYKLLNTKLIPQMGADAVAFSTHTWQGLLKHLLQMQHEGSQLEEGLSWRADGSASRCANVAVASWLSLRGSGCAVSEIDVSRFADRRPYAPWTPRPVLASWSNAAHGSYPKSAAIVSNDQSFTPVLERSVARAHDMFSASAFVHQYAAHGVGEEYFEDAFARCEQVLFDYRKLSE